MRCHFSIRIFFKLGSAGWYCVTKGSILLHAALFFCLSADFLSVNLTSESSFFTRPTGYPLDVRRVSKFLICPSNVFSEEFVLRILNASPLIMELDFREVSVSSVAGGF